MPQVFIETGLGLIDYQTENTMNHDFILEGYRFSELIQAGEILLFVSFGIPVVCIGILVFIRLITGRRTA